MGARARGKADDRLGAESITSSTWRHDALLPSVEAQKRATVYFAPDVHRALRLKAAALDRSISDMVNEAVQAALAEDADDPDRPL